MNPMRMTPSNSPFFKTSTPRSPTKIKNEEPGLKLKKVIGTTAASANGFDCLPAARQFAYTAGAAAVVCTVDSDLRVTQRFFRARPLGAGSRDTNGSWPMTPTPGDPRSRLLGGRDQGLGGSPLGASGRDWSDSPIGKSTTAKDRVKAATSVALSPNGKWVAVGETGYKPRVLIFPNGSQSSEAPVSALAEHTFGVHALAFSPNSRYLASLGTVNDGFLYIWNIDDRTGTATLNSSNKCTVVVNVMTWVGRSVLTVGLRFVKLWKPDEDIVGPERPQGPVGSSGTPRQRGVEFGNSILSPKHKVLVGKNSLLGDLIDASFVTAVPISDDKAIVCTDGGEICLLDDCHGAQTLTAVAATDFRITAARTDQHGGLHVTGVPGYSKRFDLHSLEHGVPTTVKRRRSANSTAKNGMSNMATTMAMATIDNTVVELDSRRGIRLTKAGDDSDEDAEVASVQLAAHGDAVLGVKQLACERLPQAAFLTFAGSGSIQIWDIEGASVASFQVPVESSAEMYEVTNELREVAHLGKTTSLLATGDRYGTLSLLDMSSGSVVVQVRAHSSEVVKIVAFERLGVQLVATASRDRTVQLFSWNRETLDLLQTMDEHAAAVSDILVAGSSDTLLSCSTDRTVVVREAMDRADDDPTSVAFVILRTINLKSSPAAMCLSLEDTILVATADRSVNAYNYKTGRAGFSFKGSDNEAGEAVHMSKVLYAPSLNGNPTIVGAASSDKSVRLYSEFGSLIARDWGHTEGITDICLLGSETVGHSEHESRRQLVTVAADSTIFVWDTISPAASISRQASEENGVPDSTTTSKLTPMAPPLRNVLSYTELSRARREKSIEEGESASPIATDTPSPIATDTPSQPSSPQRLRTKPSRPRMSVSQAPRLEPVHRSGFSGHSRRSSLRKRSPSPPSPRGTKRDVQRKSPLGMSLRSKSSENVLTTFASRQSALAESTSSSTFGSLTSSTESVCRTLRAYRKKLANSSASESISPDTLRELERELKLTARAVGEKSQGKNIDEAMVAKLLDQASEKIVNRLDERIKERVECEVRKSTEGSPAASGMLDSSPEVEEHNDGMDAVVGAFENVDLGQ